MAMRFLIHNYGPIFSDYAASSKGSFSAVPVPQAARHGSAGKRWAQQHVDKRGALQRHPNRPRVNLLKSVQSPGSHRPAAAAAAGRKHAAHHQQLYASGMLVRNSAEVCQFILLSWDEVMRTGASFCCCGYKGLQCTIQNGCKTCFLLPGRLRRGQSCTFSSIHLHPVALVAELRLKSRLARRGCFPDLFCFGWPGADLAHRAIGAESRSGAVIAEGAHS